jgi:hypothetical protein
MDKNWLIRTKSNHILGPVSKDKVLELYHNGSIKPDDEVCTGNGYWFFIREEELVARYLTGNTVQGFNPISEAKDVLTSKDGESEGSHEPDDITRVGGINISMLNKPQTPQAVPDMPPMPEETQTSSAHASREVAPSENKKKNRITPRLKPSGDTRVLKPVKRQDWMKYVAILGFIFLFFLVYFRNVIINYIFQGEITQISIISPVYAQEDVPGKKKSF